MNLKSVLLTLLTICCAGNVKSQELPQEVTKIEITSTNKEYPRAQFMTYPKRDLAMKDDYMQSIYYQSLNGTWKFKYLNSHKLNKDEFYESDYDDSSWNDMEVPSNWSTKGYEEAIYADSVYDFKHRNPQPPTLPNDIPVGVYRKEFHVPYEWDERETFLNIGAIKSGSIIYVNGQKVGYNEDSKNPAEFNITKYIKEGVNQLAIETYKWSTGSYLECQDFWRLNGIEREVYIISQPKVRIRDFLITTTLDPSYTNGYLELGIVMKSHYLNPKEKKIYYEMYAPNGDFVSGNSKFTKFKLRAEDTTYFSIPIQNVYKWSAEIPNLYTVIVRVQNEDGRFSEYIQRKVGFRSIEIKENQLLVNGEPIIIKGVNLHEHHTYSGHVVDSATMIKDFEMMKKLNINAIRCSHYPQNSFFYQMTDKYGFYVCDQANIESHAMGRNLRKGYSLGNNPAWLAAHMERTLNMYERNKTHASVIFWSLGNESGNGYNFYKTYQMLKSKDKYRPIQYNHAGLEWNSDIFFPQHSSIKDLKKWGKADTDRPYIISGYDHNEKSIISDFKTAWTQIENYPNLQGGFIWNWVDQSLWSDKNGGTWKHSHNYNRDNLSNSILSSDRKSYRSDAHEIKKVYQDIIFSNFNQDSMFVDIKNKFFFTNLNTFKFKYEIIDGNDDIVATGELIDVDIKPLKERTIRITDKFKPKSGVEYLLNISAETIVATDIVESGYAIANERLTE